MRIGYSTIPGMRVPALLKGQMILFNLATLRGQWGIISCLPSFDYGEAIFLNQCYRTVQKEGAILLGMSLFEDPFLNARQSKTNILRIPLLADPLQRLRRVFGVSENLRANRSQSYFIDPQGVIRYHLIHPLNWRGLSFLIEILKHCQEQYPSPNKTSQGERSFLTLKNIVTQPWRKAIRMTPTLQPKLNVCECGNLHLSYQSVTRHFSRIEFFHFAVQVNRMAASISRTPLLPHTWAFDKTEDQRFSWRQRIQVDDKNDTRYHRPSTLQR